MLDAALRSAGRISNPESGDIILSKVAEIGPRLFPVVLRLLQAEVFGLIDVRLGPVDQEAVRIGNAECALGLAAGWQDAPDLFGLDAEVQALTAVAMEVELGLGSRLLPMLWQGDVTKLDREASEGVEGFVPLHYFAPPGIVTVDWQPDPFSLWKVVRPAVIAVEYLVDPHPTGIYAKLKLVETGSYEVIVIPD